MKANQLEQQAKCRGIPISSHQNTPNQAKLPTKTIKQDSTSKLQRKIQLRTQAKLRGLPLPLYTSTLCYYIFPATQ